MASWDDVRRVAMALPGVEEAPRRSGTPDQPGWSVAGKVLAWDRPLRASDRAALGDAAPDGPILCVRTPDLDAKEAVLQAEPEATFTTPHFNGYPAVLVDLARAPVALIEELVTEIWLARAPKRVVREWQARGSAAAG